MSNFWDLSDGNQVESKQEFELSTRQPVIPSGTRCRAYIEEAVIASSDYVDVPYVQLKWRITKPAEHQNIVIRQKLHIDSRDDKKSDNAKRMLASIDANCGGNLVKGRLEPSEQNMSKYLLNHFMDITVDVWRIEKDDNGKPLPEEDVREGNWIRQISAASGHQAPQTQAKPTATRTAPASRSAAQNAIDNQADMDDGIPF